MKKTMVISGKTFKSFLLNWIDIILQKDWVDGVNVVKYKTGRKSNITEFHLEILIRDEMKGSFH